jgi:(2Fe-2S) ferredoxin
MFGAAVPKKYTILVCRGPECGDKRHSADVHAAFKRELAATPLGGNEVTLDLYSCFGKCQRGVNVLVREMLPTDNAMMIRLMPTAGGRASLYHRVLPSEARRIIEEHVARGTPLVEMTQRK